MSEALWRIPDELVQALLNEIEDKGKVHAKAKAHLAVIQQKLKTTKALLCKLAEAEGIKAHQRQDTYAHSHPTFRDLAERQLYKAIEDEVNAEVGVKNAEREYEAWRTISANERHAR